MNKRLLILGGYGNTGRQIARLLLQESAAEVLLAGRNLDKATAAAEALNREFAANRARALRVDAADRQSLDTACQQVDLVVAASSTAEHVETVARAALAAGIDYLDVQYSTAKLRTLEALRGEIEQAGCCFISDGGFHPGLPAALVRYAAGQFDRLETANIGSVIKIDWNALDFSPATIEELAREILDFQPLVYRDGRWTELGWNEYRQFTFDAPFGDQSAMAMLLEEMRDLPEMIPSLRETGFYVGGFNWFSDFVVIPAGMLALRLWPEKALQPVGRLLEWSLKAFSHPPYGTILLLEASGQKAGRPESLRLSVSHEDGYLLTAVPVVACLLQYLDGAICRPGLWFQANIVDPDRLLEDMKRMGIAIRQGEAIETTGDIDMITKKRRWKDLSPAQRGLTIAGSVVQFGLMAAALWDLRRRPAEQIRGKKWIWGIAAGSISFFGPLAYFFFARKPSR